MADQPQPTALDHAASMLDHLRAHRPGDGHDLARAMLAASAVYLVEVFGREHALQTASDLLRPVLGIGDVPELLPGETVAAVTPGPGVVLH